jgi:hypothetical protein
MKYTDEQIEQIKSLFIEGKTKKQISQATGISVSQIWYVIYDRLKLHERYPRVKKVEKPKKEVTPYIINRIITLTNWGYHCKEIAEDQGVPPSEVRRVIEEATYQKKIEKKV